uniref:Macaca fascicularis brain cDNA clone: QtrA-17476, similar to human Chediak-Higashi syndrome 1 (CHS1), mRNA, RefSeq: NM_000081.1 n=1 Tax=Macaca fascicularis TaxID=9541 RepID=I7GB05_MACFA|nr:unnamed protein product [Macaca fascicularis]
MNLKVRQFLPVSFLAQRRTRIFLTATNKNTGILDFRHILFLHKNFT